MTLHKAETGEGELGAVEVDSHLATDSSDQHRIRRALTSLGGPAPTASTVDNLTKIIRSAHERRLTKLEQDSISKEAASRNCESTAAVDGRSGTHTVVVESTGQTSQETGDPHLMLCDNPDHIPFDHAMPIASDEIENEEFESGLSKKRHRSPFRRHAKARKSNAEEGTVLSADSPGQNNQKAPETLFGGSPSERDTTGTPFLRVPERLRRARSKDSRRKLAASQTDGAESPVEDGIGDETQPGGEQAPTESQDDNVQYKESEKTEDPSILVPVGVSRLHMVEMPNLTMGPIYWDPVHDISDVVRGTWFYKDSMLPVEPNVANQIEEGYEYIRPWTSTYQDELNSCLEVGPEAELKLTHRLWPQDTSSAESRPTTSKSRRPTSRAADFLKPEPDIQVRMAATAAAKTPENRAAGVLSSQAVDAHGKPSRLYPKCSIIYVNARDAQILKPNQIPNPARGRRPLASIKKGRPIGVPLVRGFDYKAWERLHPPSKRQQNAAAARKATETIRAAGTGRNGSDSCGACLLENERPRVTDLVLVIHGIGQKLSERVESFHFTHAINAFRRSMNIELEAEAVKPCLREDLGSVMVLPINWRSTLQLDDGSSGPQPNRWEDTPDKNQFTLKDITAESIPAVRNLISDVMLDIPYYLSHHKKKMIEAVVREANRVYRLWIKNNPGFEHYGKVHLVAHSLGSIMALDILSNQPTERPAQPSVESQPRNDIFEFDTKNLFFCGSPAGFFMLLNKSPLLPRKGRNKPSADGDELNGALTGEMGTYGCLAVDNLYNVMHYNDPIAYRLNACVDVDYAASLQPASVPSATATWMQSFTSVFRSSKPTITSSINHPAADGGGGVGRTFSLRPSVVKMPTTVEMETHDFSKEEIAEKRMFLMNDNGQIDYTLHSAGGPLEIQYLNMLSAHSSYWVLRDFVRFLVVEIGRKGGREETLMAMRAVKRKKL
ncbi:MAG: hypothetical protein Q9191_008033 [Dirinaria sp. TL-2023a]